MPFLLKKDSSYRDTDVTVILIQAITLNLYFIGFQRICVHVARSQTNERQNEKRQYRCKILPWQVVYCFRLNNANQWLSQVDIGHPGGWLHTAFLLILSYCHSRGFVLNVQGTEPAQTNIRGTQTKERKITKSLKSLLVFTFGSSSFIWVYVIVLLLIKHKIIWHSG